MVLLSSKKARSDFIAPDFSLPSVDGNIYNLADLSNTQALLIAFICNHCPYVKSIEDRLIKIAKSFAQKDLQVIGICSNDARSYPDDSPKELYKRWQEKNYGFPYLIDEDQSVAKAYDAQCTPDLYLFDQTRHLYYRGRLDDSWQDQSLVKTEELKNAICDLLAKKPAPKYQHPSIGCSIKWKNH